MLRIHFTTADLARLTVAAHANPMWEIVFSGFRLRERHSTVIHRPWVSALGATPRVRTPAVRAGIAALAVLAPLGPYFPDFLTPPEGGRGLTDGLDALCRTPHRELREQLTRLAGRNGLPSWVRPLADGDTAALTRLAQTLRSYHEAAIAPHATLTEQGVAADHAHRVHRFMDGGAEALLASLRPMMRWRPPVLEVDYDVDRDLYLDGRGLRLVPSYFCHRVPVSLADPELPPMLVYPIAQQFALPQATRSPDALDRLLGPTRRAVLQAIGTGATTTELARRTGASLASVSRHTAVLRDAGLVRCDRDGASVVHTTTALGAALLGADGE